VAFAVAKPVHEEAKLSVHHENRRQHVDGDTECNDATKKSEDERCAADEFRPNSSESYDQRQTYKFGQSAYKASLGRLPCLECNPCANRWLQDHGRNSGGDPEEDGDQDARRGEYFYRDLGVES
jgi:hypothetical protein